MDDHSMWIDGDTLLTVSVNLIPIAILLFFVGLFAVVTPWPPNPLLFAVGHALTILPIAFLALLTYVAAAAFKSGEGDLSVRGRDSMSSGNDHRGE